MSGGMSRHQILKNIDSGMYIFRPESSKEEDKVIGFQAAVNVIKSVEKAGFVKVVEYRLSKNFPHHHPKLIDLVIVENLTVEGEQELKRLNEVEHI